MSTTKDMEIDQISNTEVFNIEESMPQDGSTTTPKVKNPKKVKAGKALARKNAEARKNEEARKNDASLRSEEISPQELPSINVDVPTIYNGILSIASLVGAGFTLYHGWKFFETSDWSNDSSSLQTKLIPNKPKVDTGDRKESSSTPQLPSLRSEKVDASLRSEKVPLVSPSLRG